MTAVIEVSSYRAKDGMRDRLLELMRERDFPLQQDLGMKLLGPFASREGETTIEWLRGFPDEPSRGPFKTAFYEGADWLGGLSDEVLPRLDDYEVVVVQDTADLWPTWPVGTTPG